MKRKTLIISAAAATIALGVAAFATAPTFAHGSRGYGGYMGHGYSQGMMRHHMEGYGKGQCGQWGQSQTDRNLGIDDVREIVEGHISMMGNDRLKAGKVESIGENAIIAEVVTVDDSLVWKIQFDTKTGAHQRLN